MGRELFANNGSTTLNGAINNSVTSIVVTDGSVFPASNFRIIIGSELLFCSSRSTNTLTVIRGIESTTAASHADLDPVKHVLTAGGLDGLFDNILAAAGMVPRDASLSTADDDFNDENFSGWTTVQGTPNCTVTEKSHRSSILIPTGSASAQHYSFVKAKAPSVNDYVQAGFHMIHPGSQFPIGGLIIADGNTYNAGKQVMFGWSPNENLYILRGMNNYNADIGSPTSVGNPLHSYPMGAMHMRLVWKGSNQYDALISPDGVTWATVLSAQSKHTLGTPTHMGFSMTNWGATKEAVFSYLYCRFSF